MFYFRNSWILSCKYIYRKKLYYLDTLKPEYNIAKHAGFVLGLKHTEAFIEAIRKHKLGVLRTGEEKLSIANSSPSASSVAVTEIETGIVKYFLIYYKCSKLHRNSPLLYRKMYKKKITVFTQKAST